MEAGVKPKKEKSAKPVYNLWQNSAYMIAFAWKKRKSVLWLSMILATVGVLLNLVQLFATPTILGEIQAAVPMGRLIRVIVLFTGALVVLNASNRYFGLCTDFGRMEVRHHIMALVEKKRMTISFPSTGDQDIQKKMNKARMTANNNGSATHVVWTTLTDLLKNLMGFVIYIPLLGSLNPLLIAVVLITTVASFSLTNYLNGWGYRHRDEEAEYSRKMSYLSGRSQDYTLAKDVRIFGMRSWLENVYANTLRLYQAFIARGEKVYIWGNVADVILTVARNGIAYLFFIGMVLHGDLTAAQFLLYFSMVGVFTAGMTGVLSGFSALHKQSLDISAMREFLEHPEPFLFETGDPLEPDLGKPYQIDLRNVSFRYPGADKDTLSQINLTISPGGETGCRGFERRRQIDADETYLRILRPNRWRGAAERHQYQTLQPTELLPALLRCVSGFFVTSRHHR